MRCVGDWAYEKVYLVVRYCQIFAGGMKQKWQGRLNYVEICSGPGRCIQKDTGQELDGTALAVVRSTAFTHLCRAIFIDSNPQVIKVLNSRLNSCGCSPKASAIVGDYADSDSLLQLLHSYDLSGLNLIFIDPTDCSVPFDTLMALRGSIRNFDLLVNIAIGTDVTRNIKIALTEPNARVRQKYISFLGRDTFFRDARNKQLANAGDDQALRLNFFQEYCDQLSRIGFPFTDAKPVRHYYYIAFASGDERGLDFWRKINVIDSYGQRELI